MAARERGAEPATCGQGDPAAAARASLALANRIVIKIGTATIMKKGEAGGTARPGSAGGVDVEYLHHMAAQVAALTRAGKQIIIVTSGAIGMGARELGIPRKVRELRMRQACAAIGQIALMDEYRRAFGVFGLLPAQLLVTRDAWDNRSAYLNLRASVETLLEAGAIPVFNENDVVSTAEIGNAFGDNDQLSAYVASKADAELLVILSDIDALYDADPRANPAARPIPYVSELSPGIIAAAGGAGSEFSTGGMATKLKAVEIARDAGCKVVIADGRLSGVVSRILVGEPIGTLFDAAGGLKNRQRWIKNSSPLGSLVIDEGALEAIRAKNSLLPRGIKAVEGSFERGDIVILKLEGSGEAVAKIVSTLSSSELARVAGLRSGEVG
ncbi:MAG: glutamate 5-kinase, partial [Spirochaetota bacterium]